MRIAVVGSGIAGLAAAWSLSRRHEVVLYEAERRLGGHAHTVTVRLDGRLVPVDTGFIVYNELNYPNLTALFGQLGVATVASDMSFAVSLDRGRYEYSGSIAGLVAQPANVVRPSHWAMLRDVVRFYRTAPGLLDRGMRADTTIGDVLAEGGYSRVFLDRHLLPMAAAIWSCPLGDVSRMPAETFIRFFDNHRLFSLGERPRWRTVVGGSREYVQRLAADFDGTIRLGAPVAAVHRTPAGVTVRDGSGHTDRFDAVVMGCHADQALRILGDEATPAERQTLGAVGFRPNRAILHTDRSLMPRRRRAWASWNYMARGEDARGSEAGVALSYWMNRLQPLGVRKPVILSLNPLDEPAPETVLGSWSYDHPAFDAAAVAAQRRLPAIQGTAGIWYCGAWTGFGFHEDGLSSALGVARALGCAAPWEPPIDPRVTAPVAADYRVDSLEAA